MPLAEIRDGVVIGMLVGRQEAKGHIFMGSGFDLARAIDPHAGAVKQEPQHHLWRIGRLAAAILGIVRGIDRTKVQRLHYIHQKARKMLLWKPIVQRRRQQQSLIQIVGAKTLSHEQHLKTDAHSSKRFCRTRESIPDTLLVTVAILADDGEAAAKAVLRLVSLGISIGSISAIEGVEPHYRKSADSLFKLFRTDKFSSRAVAGVGGVYPHGFIVGEPLCANMCETSRPSTITVGRGKKSHFDEHKQDKQFFRCVGSFSATLRSCQRSGRPSVGAPAAVSRF